MREICEAAEVNLASINYHFGDKQKLYLETVLLARQMRADEFPETAWSADVPPEIKLRQIVSLLLNRLMALQAEPWQVRLIMREVLQPTEAARHLVEAYFRPFFNQLLSIVDELVGVRLPDFERQQIGFSITGQCLHYRLAAEMISMLSPASMSENNDTERLAEHITSFSLGGIANLREQHQSNSQTPTPCSIPSSQGDLP